MATQPPSSSPRASSIVTSSRDAADRPGQLVQSAWSARLATIEARSSTVVSGLTMHHRRTVSPHPRVGVTKALLTGELAVAPRLVVRGIPAQAAEQHDGQLGLDDQLEVRRGAYELGAGAGDRQRGLDGVADRRRCRAWRG